MAGGGFSIESFFLHCSQIVLQVSEDIQAANFVVPPWISRQTGRRPVPIIDAEIFQSKEQCETLDLLMQPWRNRRLTPSQSPQQKQQRWTQHLGSRRWQVSKNDNAVQDAKFYLERGIDFDAEALSVRNHGLSLREAESAIAQAQAALVAVRPRPCHRQRNA